MNEHEQSQDGAAFQSEATKDLTAELTAIQQQKTENAHRVAAAIKHGDSHIQVKGRIRLYVLDESPAEL